MIEVNLLPGAKRKARRSAGGGPSFSALKGISIPEFDRWMAFIVIAWVVGLGALAWMFLGTRARAAELDQQIETAVADSSRFAAIIEQTEALRARRDTIAQKLEVIQDIDEGRYVWPHVMEELARAVPDYTWLTGVAQLEGGPTPTFQIQGRAGNNFALTRFMSNLEASPFIQRVRLQSTTRITQGEIGLHQFMLEATYQEPPASLIRTEPLFAQESTDDGAAAE